MCACVCQTNKFAFLGDGHPYYAYFVHRMKAFKEGATMSESDSDSDDSDSDSDESGSSSDSDDGEEGDDGEGKKAKKKKKKQKEGEEGGEEAAVQEVTESLAGSILCQQY